MSRTSRILVVDDQESSRTFVARLLAESGYETVLADSVAAAMPHVESGEVDLVVPRFAPDGSVVRGPAPKALPWLEVKEIAGGTYVVDEGSVVPPGTKVTIA